MPSPDIITPAKLARRIGLPEALILMDVRTPEDFVADPRALPGARRASHGDVADWAESFRGRAVVGIGQKGLKLSQGVAAWLRHYGATAETLKGGFLGWAEAGLGLSRMYRDDLAQLEAGITLYDAFFRWCRGAAQESHNWPTGRPA